MNPEVSAPANNRWPPQIKYIIGNEAAERFSYYGMRSILALYITSALMQTKDRATTVIHLFVFANYFLPLFGAWLSDRIWGRYKTILWISLFYCAGHGVLATSDLFASAGAKLNCLYIGLGLIAFGSGGIKPCVSAFMGDQFAADQGHLMRKAYGAFYFSINFGSFFSFLVIPWIAARQTDLGADAGFFDHVFWQMKHAGFSGYSWAFGVPGILMALATLIFWLGTKHYVRKPPANETRTAGFFTVFLTAFNNLGSAPLSLRLSGLATVLTSVVLPTLATVGMLFVSLYVMFQHGITPLVKTIGWISLGSLIAWYALLILSSLWFRSELPDAFWLGARKRFNNPEISAARSVAPILAVFAFIIPFWALFDQSNSTWVMQGNQMSSFIFLGIKVGAEQMQSINPVMVMILVPVLTWGLYPLLEKLGLRVTPLRRMSLGMVLGASSFVLVGWMQQRIEGGETLSLALQTWPYVILTVSEVLVSTTGLEFAYTQAASSMKSSIMSFWLVTTAIGNLLVATMTQLLGGGHGDESVTSGRFFLYAGMMAVVGALFIIVAACYRYRDETVAEVN
jgi:POT family proton-dependent oligopeptide transporter